ncbi:MAG TPA: CheR family methyltransferase [Kofleriaceae bacterium]|nr:CheR family methyltransferase [Kofleriaceae bacterium]
MQPGAFFHEAGQLELLATGVLPALARSRRRLRLWSAGCGAGEEAWSVAMIVDEADLPAAVAVEIVATDADPRALAVAAEAVYRDDQMRPVSAERRRRHFVRGVGPRHGLWRVIAPLRDRVELRALDLDGPWPAAPGFDVVLCHAPIARLVARDAEPLVRRLAAVLTPGGALFLAGPAPPGIPGLDACAPGVYRRCTR